jgi:hypothetical protein
MAVIDAPEIGRRELFLGVCSGAVVPVSLSGAPLNGAIIAATGF